MKTTKSDVELTGNITSCENNLKNAVKEARKAGLSVVVQFAAGADGNYYPDLKVSRLTTLKD